jgi:ATPase subunit of ABC transporter with duplicated ATPase domains
VGKTCLARLLGGHLDPSDGVIQRQAAVTYFPQREVPPTISVAEYLIETSWSQLGQELLASIDPNTLCHDLSGGEWMRVRLARRLDDSYLILDEPTNDLDRDGRAVVLKFLEKSAASVLLISHDHECLRLCEDILELSSQGLMKVGGGWENYELTKQQERESRKATLENAKRQRQAARDQRQEKLLRQEKRSQRGSKVEGLPKLLRGRRQRQAQVTGGKIDSATFAHAEEAVRVAFESFQDLKVDPVMYSKFHGQEIPAQKLVAEARAFNVCFQNWLYPRDLNFSWRGNVRVALKGSNGSGKSTLLKALRGETFRTRGELRRGSLNTFYLDQRGSALDDDLSVFENIRAVSSHSESDLRSELAKFLFTKDAVFQSVRSLSGGERLRAALAMGLLSHAAPELLILDEPTNNLDLSNIEFLETVVRQFRAALVVVSHDEDFLENCGLTQVLSLEESS